LQDESYIKIALELAKKGRGIIGSSPLAGVIIVKGRKILSASFNGKKPGSDCFLDAIKEAKDSLEGATLYSNIEPPCWQDNFQELSNLIIDSKIKRIVVGNYNPAYNEGCRILKELSTRGVEVIENVLYDECVEVNKFFFNFINKKLPFVTLKIASTLDGKIADNYGDSNWITSIESRRFVHQLRSVFDAVLVGAQTVKADDPLLDVRLVEGRNPKRIIFDSKLSLSLNYKLFKNNEERNLFLITSENNKNKKIKLKQLREKGVKIIFVKEDADGMLKIKSALKKLAKENITSVLVEGGGKIFTSFLKSRVFDELVIFYAPKMLGSGISAVGNLGIDSIRKTMRMKLKSVEMIGEDAVVNIVKR